MALDGITIANIRSEVNAAITGGHIAKIIQPEPDELLITVKNNSRNHRLLLSANASLPLVYLTDSNIQAPMTAPNFCMLLRKHMAGGKVTGVLQPGLERVLMLAVEHRNEMGDLKTVRLVIELMGKHSNIILIDDTDVIIDSIKRVPFHISSVREVLPGRTYFIPQTMGKQDPLSVTYDDFCRALSSREMPLYKAVYTTLTGISPVMAEELCYRAGIDSDHPSNTLEEASRLHLFNIFSQMMEDIRTEQFSPCMIFKDKEAFEFASLPLTQYASLRCETWESVSALIRSFYAEKDLRGRIRQRSADLRRVIQTALERNGRTLALQEKQMHDTEKRDKYRIWGEMINTYGYSLEEGASSLECINYYTNEPITVPLDPQLSVRENSVRYFERYNKLKRTAEALAERIKGTEADVEHLESIAAALDIARDENDLAQIRTEMEDYGYIRRKGPTGKKKQTASSPLHYISSDGFDIYVGKNNYQNEEVSFKIAQGNDWWFHAKGIPGSHVVIKSGGRELPDRAFEEAGRLAAYYSKGRQAPKVEIDYTQKKNLRKPGGARPGFVVYYTNYSLMAEPDITGISEASN